MAVVAPLLWGVGVHAAPTKHSESAQVAVCRTPTLSAAEWPSNQKGDEIGPVLHVEVQAAIPDQLILQRASTAGWIGVDSAWMGPDGRYHIPLQAHVPGLYRLRHSTHNEPIPLYLTGGAGDLTLRTSSEAMLRKAELDGSPESAAFLAASIAYDRNGDIHQLAARMAEIALPPATMNAFLGLVDQQDRALDSAIDALAKQVQRPPLQALLSIMQRKQPQEIAQWWPADLLQSPELVGAPHIVSRMDAYLLSFQNEDYTRRQQDSAYSEAVQMLAVRPMHASMAQWLRNQLVYSLAGTSYESLGDSVLAHPFGPLPAAPANTEQAHRINPQALAKLQIRGIDGTKAPLIDPKSRYTLVVFWSIWCPHCQAMLPTLWQWYAQQPKGRISVRTICTDRHSESLVDYIKSRRWQWFNAVEAEAPNDLQSTQFGSEGIPELYLLDRQGNLVAHPATLRQLLNEPMR